MMPVGESKWGKGIAALCVATLGMWQVGYGQVQSAPPPIQAPAPAQQQGAPLLSPDQLDNLVAPVALYPDPLLGQVLAASTYPLEVVEASRWLQQNRNLQGAQLMQAARQQNWDASVAALVAFPDVMNLLNNDIQWTTDLGNAFLGQQADVMAAVQRMRARAQANGRLRSTAQETVTTDTQNGQTAIQIQPADPQVIYVPVYQPEYIWGPPLWGAYPALWYPPAFGFGFGFGWGPGIYMSAFFPGWLGWGGWGWGCGWFGGGLGLFVNVGFFNRWGFGGYGGYGGYGRFGAGYAGGRMAWAFNPAHRLGVAYPNRAVAARYGSSRYVGNGRGGQLGAMNRGGVAGANRGAMAGANRGAAGANAFGGRQFGNANRSATNGYNNSYRGSSNYGARSAGGSRGYNSGQSYRGATSAQSYRGGSTYGRSYGNSYSAPRGQSYSARSYSAPRGQSYSARSYSAPRSFSAPRSSGGGGAHFSGGGGGGHFSGGGGGGHFGGGGGGHAGGGGHGGRR